MYMCIWDMQNVALIFNLSLSSVFAGGVHPRRAVKLTLKLQVVRLWQPGLELRKVWVMVRVKIWTIMPVSQRERMRAPLLNKRPMREPQTTPLRCLPWRRKVCDFFV